MSSNYGSRLAEVSVMIVDPDARLTEVTRRVLQSFGFKKILVSRSGSHAVSMLAEQSIDLLICEWEMEGMSGLSLVNKIRKGETNAAYDMPIIMLTGHSERYHVESARDSGVTEYLAKPFNAKTLSHRLVQVIEHPRFFLQTSQFNGPDRRRRSDENTENSRTLSLEKIIELAEPTDDNRMRYHKDDIEIFLSNPNIKMKRKIGLGINILEIFSPESIKQAQQEISNAKEDFVRWVIEDLEKLEHIYSEIQHDETSGAARVDIQKIAFNIMSQSGSFNFPLGTQVGKLLHDYMRDSRTPNMTVLRKHIDTLYVIFQKRLEGTDQQIHGEIVDMLHSLMRKLG